MVKDEGLNGYLGEYKYFLIECLMFNIFFYFIDQVL